MLCTPHSQPLARPDRQSQSHWCTLRCVCVCVYVWNRSRVRVCVCCCLETFEERVETQVQLEKLLLHSLVCSPAPTYTIWDVQTQPVLHIHTCRIETRTHIKYGFCYFFYLLFLWTDPLSFLLFLPSSFTCRTVIHLLNSYIRRIQPVSQWFLPALLPSFFPCNSFYPPPCLTYTLTPPHTHPHTGGSFGLINVLIVWKPSTD